MTQDDKGKILDIILEEYDNDPEVFRLSLKKAKLRAEIDAIETEIRNLRTELNASIESYNIRINDLIEQAKEKNAELKKNY